MIEIGTNLMNAIYAVCGTVFGIGCLILFWYLVKGREPINPLDKCLKNNDMWKIPERWLEKKINMIKEQERNK